MSVLLAACATFVAMHLFPSTPWRSRAVAAMGEGAYLGLFSLLSLASMAWMGKAFRTADYGEKLWLVPPSWLWVKAALMLFALFLIVASIATPNPSLPGAGKVLTQGDPARSVFGITRHPLMWGIGLWAIAHLITQATPRGLLFFGAFALVAIGGAWLQDRRKARSLGAPWAAFEKETSFFPFAALLEGRGGITLRAIGWWRIALAVLLWAAILHLHARLFGVSPLPI